MSIISFFKQATYVFMLATTLVGFTSANSIEEQKTINDHKFTATESTTVSKLLDEVVIEQPYVKINPTGENAAAYVIIKNTSGTQIKLIDVSIDNTDMIKKIEIHDHIITDKIAKMVPIKKGIKINSKSAVELKEGGKHIMLLGINKDLIDKQNNINLTLKFYIDNHKVEMLQNFEIRRSDKKNCCCGHKQPVADTKTTHK